MMKISVVIPSFYPAFIYGGTIHSSLNACTELALLGEEVRVSTTNTNMYSRLDVQKNSWVTLKGIQVKYYNETIVDKLSLRLICSVWKDIREADVVHVQAIFNTPTPAALLYARMMNKPVLLSPRGVLGDWIMNQGNGFKNLWLKWLIRPFAGYVTWHATAEQEAIEIRSRFPEAKTVVIPNGIHTEPFLKDPWLNKKKYLQLFSGQELPEHTKVIVSMGRLHKKKGFDLLIDAFAEVLKIQPDTFLLIAGPDEGELFHLQQQVIKNGLKNRVVFTGALDEEQKISFFVHADIFVLPSHNENFGNVYAEALAAGLPVITSIYTPWLDLDEKHCGKAVELNVPSITNAIIAYINSDKKHIAHITRAYISEYSWSTIAKNFQSVFYALKEKKQ